jgi:DNA polymerase/3'-5' exonuclease PolX
MNNHLIADKLLEHARGLDRCSNLYRIRAYRHAAMVLQGLDQPVEEILRQQGRQALANIPGIGQHIAFTIDMLVRKGLFMRWPERKELAQRIAG